MRHPLAAFHQCQVCGNTLNDAEVERGRCGECKALNSAVAVFEREEGEWLTFEEAWAIYPKRAGGNPQKLARKAWEARMKCGVRPEDLYDATMRYAAYIRATGREGTEFVMQACTFYGPNERYGDVYVAGAKPDPELDEILKEVERAYEG